jgi:hypothetical protein
MIRQETHDRLKRLGWCLVALAAVSSGFATFMPTGDPVGLYMLSAMFLLMALFALSASWYAKTFPKK